ncbi:MAG TPA: ribbon-helix-helix domain-containing protein [Verrucomicrobiota bacterium]|nr:ribbon-helix-helix domain-containing protein [Verrucomicrobiota bacterium]
MKTFSVKLPEPLADWLNGEAKQTLRSRSETVREALELKRDGNAKRDRTMADAMADLRGTISGPRDLSTNPKYFADFGR